MNTDSDNNRSYSQWDIDRYLLSDPSLDRDAFEQQMLDDIWFAEQVANSVADLQSISFAARSTLSKTSAVPHVSPIPYSEAIYRWAPIVTAAVILIAVSAWQFRSPSNDDQLSLIADNWVAFENLTTVESLELIANDGHFNEVQSADDQADTESNEQSDWLVEAAREFYLAKNEGFAG
jgi:hypothetical protein